MEEPSPPDVRALEQEIARLRKTVVQHERLLEETMLALGKVVRGLADYFNVVAGNFLVRSSNNYLPEVTEVMQRLFDAMAELQRAVEQVRAE